jgi:cytochrome c biogenesis protein CcmG/thiol:disulfide interchange protein DsbE
MILRAVGLALVALALAGCGATASGAGTPVATAPSVSAPSGSVSPADPSLVAQAALKPCPSSAATGSAPAGSRTLPDTSLPCLGAGPAVRLTGLAGTPTVVNVWATWCTECRAELPLLAHLASSTPGVRVIGVDAQDDPSSALSLLARAGVHYPSVRDDSGSTKAALQWGSGLPVTLFVRADGSVAFQQHGALADQQQLTDLVREHLGVTAGS